MSQSDLTIQNQSFPSFRSDLNDALSAINSFQSGTTRPASAVVGTIWLDITSATTPTLKYYDGADDISLATLDHASNTVNWLDSTVAFDIINDITPQLGGMLDVNGQAIGDGTLELIKFSETASAVNEITVTNSATGTAPEISATGDDTDVDLKITPKGAGNLILDGFEFPNTDGTAGQVLQTDGYANLSFASLATPSSDFVRLATTTITTNTASVSFDGFFTSDYDTYIIYGNAVEQDTDSRLRIRLRKSNADITTSNYFSVAYGFGSDGNGNNITVTAATSFDSTENSGGSTNFRIGFQTIIYNPLSAYFQFIQNKSSYMTTAGIRQFMDLSGFLNDNTTALSGITYLPSAGNLDSGTIVLYGVKK